MSGCVVFSMLWHVLSEAGCGRRASCPKCAAQFTLAERSAPTAPRLPSPCTAPTRCLFHSAPHRISAQLRAACVLLAPAPALGIAANWRCNALLMHAPASPPARSGPTRRSCRATATPWMHTCSTWTRWGTGGSARACCPCVLARASCLTLLRPAPPHRLLRLLALSLGLPADHFDAHFTQPMLFLRPLHYAPRVSAPEEGLMAAGAHTDYGMLTLLVRSRSQGSSLLARGATRSSGNECMRAHCSHTARPRAGHR